MTRRSFLAGLGAAAIVATLNPPATLTRLEDLSPGRRYQVKATRFAGNR